MSTQFPPSSPFLDHHTNDDPFNSISVPSKAKNLIINSPFGKGKTQKADYPTPNPSSSNGRSSSPARHQSEEITKETPIRQEQKISNDDSSSQTLNVSLYPNHKITLGRSSKCDYFIKSKYASREHLNVQYNQSRNEITIHCKGYNSIMVNFNKLIFGYIKQIEDNYYKFILKKTSSSEDEKFNELAIFQNETIVLPYIEDLSLDLKSYKIKFNFLDDESETEDETPVLSNNRLSSIEPQSQEFQTPKPIQDNTFELEATVTKPQIYHDPEEKEEKEDKQVAELEKTSETDHSEDKIDDEKSKEVKLENVQEKVLSETTEIISTPKRSQSAPIKTPLKQKDSNSLNKESQPRRRKAEPGLSPQKKKPDQTVKYLNPKEKIESLNIEEILSTIEGLDDITNVLTNHLAFSRLSQTPIKQLQSVSQLISKLTRQQLRAVLASVECIGVIYRHGKDAAGKPLDEEYYYDVEKDSDLERTRLVSSIKGSSGLRNCRKTHKQYFWKKPVTKK